MIFRLTGSNVTKVEEVKERMARLRPDSERLWGEMNPAQALEHCCRGIELAVGDRIPPRRVLGRIIGRIVKPMALGNDEGSVKIICGFGALRLTRWPGPTGG